VEEVSAYVRALNHGLGQLRDPHGLPLSVRLLRDMHRILLSTGRGRTRQPGELRRSQNWIGGTRPGNAQFVPPPWEDVEPALAQLERYIHGSSHPLVKSALAHAQFETIHPFLDGNGRIGRLLIPLMLCSDALLDQPLLYLSLYLKRHRGRYYELLTGIRQDGDWESWLAFYADGIAETAATATATTRRVVELHATDRQRIAASGRVAASLLRVHDVFARRAIVVSAPDLASQLEMARPTVYKSLDGLVEMGIVAELSGRRRGRVWAYQEYLAILNADTEDPFGPDDAAR